MPACDADNSLPDRAKPTSIGARILLLPPFRRDPGWRDVAAGIDHYIHSLEGFRLDVQAPPARPGNYPTTVQRALESKPDIVILPVHDTEIMQPFASLAVDSGATVITYGASVETRGIYGHVEVNWLDGIGELARRLPEIAAPKRSYVLVHQSGAYDAATECYERFTTVTGRHFSLSKLDESNLFETKLDQGTSIRRMLARYRHTGMIVSLAPEFWWTASDDAINGLPCPFVTIGAPPAMWRWLENGKAAALVGVNNGAVGRELARIAVQATGGSQDSPFRVITAEVITRENLPDFRARYLDATGQNIPQAQSQPAARQRKP